MLLCEVIDAQLVCIANCLNGEIYTGFSLKDLI